MAKGQMAKEAIKNKILEVFPNSFVYSNGKEVRINWEEEAGPVQIKVTLTAAKDFVTPGGVVEKPAAVASESDPLSNFPEPHKPVEPTPEEKQNVEDLLKSLGLA